MGVTGPIEQPGISHSPAQRRAVAANGFGERVDHQAGLTALGWNSAGEVTVLSTTYTSPCSRQKLPDAVQIGHLGAGVGHGFHKHHAGVGRGAGGAGLGGIDTAMSMPSPRSVLKHHAVGVAEHKPADHQVVARLQQREEHRAEAMPVAKQWCPARLPAG